MSSGLAISSVATEIINDEPRASAFDIGRALGFGRVRKVKDLIASNQAQIEEFGPILGRPTVGRGRNQHGETGATYTVDVPWLNEGQALVLAIKSQTPNAVAVQNMLIRVFMAARHGRAAELASVRAIDDGARLRDNQLFATHCSRLIGGVAKAHGRHWQSVHGELRKAFRVPSYGDIRISGWPTVKEWLLAALTQPSATAPQLMQRASNQLMLAL